MIASDPTAYSANWYTESMVANAPRGRLTVETDADVCVVGAGLAGLTAARELARRGWSVVVLEAGRIASNASGRNTGFVLPGFASGAEQLIARVGRDHARAVWALSEAGAEYVRKTIRETRMPGVALDESGWLHVSKTGDAGVAAYADLLAGEFGARAEHWPAERVRAALKSPLYFSAVHYPRAFTMHPLNYALGLAAAAEAEGVRIFEDTPAVEIDPAGVRKRIVTPSARVRASHVVLAGNVDAAALAPRTAGTLLPISTYVIVTEPLGEKLREAIGYKGAVSDTELANNHYRVVGGDRLMWSGRSTTWRGQPQRYIGRLVGDIARAYPQLGEVKAEHAWTGVLGNTVHRMPQIGELLPGLWVLSGFGGHGLNTTAMGGDLVARAISENDQTWRLFLPFELVWAGGGVGRAVAQAYYWSYTGHERTAGWLARRRDEKQRRATEPAAPETAGQALSEAAETAALSAVLVGAEAATADPVSAPEALQPKRKKKKGKKGKATRRKDPQRRHC